MSAVVALLAAALAGWGTRTLRYRLRLGVRCVRCGDSSWGATLCLSCEQVEQKRGLALGSKRKQRAFHRRGV